MQNIEFINIVPFNPLISKCQIKVCWVGDSPNRNKSIITKETAREMAKSLPGSPIVGHWNEETGDFDRHNRVIEIKDGKFQLKADTVPYGFVDLNAKIWFQFFLDKDGVQREYLVTEGWLWTGQFPECQRVLEQGDNESMELDKNLTAGTWTKDVNGNNQFFIINEAIISKLCILGENVEPCFEGANITAPKIEFAFEDDFKTKLFSMMTEIKNILNEGGAQMDANNTPVTEEPIKTPEEPIAADPVTEEPVVTEPGAPIVEPVAEPVQYNLEEIPEYVELQNKYSDLDKQMKDLQLAFENLKADNTNLTNFKANIEKKEKEDMIKSFYMLSDEDKKDVIDNIDTYSLNDIEAKLSILCVRNKVNFSLEDTSAQSEPVTYSLNDAVSGVDNAPEWIKAVRAITNEN